ncbi:MAG: hypothetical protein APF80_16220 [Alphaproteobacteria bacterium BRH_c36]|nr:MAG: hypothetical protein APF80_16220 [Alphaproteobacteria bacterium BRH_c36]
MLSRTRVYAFAIAIVVISSPAMAASLPEIETSAKNRVPACVTPGRIGAFLKSRNPSLHQRYEDLGVYYMRHGENLNIRWDMAFYQMVVETNTLRYTGDVRAEQFNFAGLGATGGGVKGEHFKTVSDGVQAHLEHVAMYAGKRIDSPVAERTRKVQEWEVLVPYQRSLSGPMTFTQLGRKWAPSDRGYSDDIQAIADEFSSSFCNAPDPRPEQVALARATTSTASNSARPVAKKVETVATAAVLAPENSDTRSGLGAGSLVGLSKSAQTARDAAAQTPPAIINEKAGDSASVTAEDKQPDPIKTAMAAGQAKSVEAKPVPGKCRVWTASYGGAKAIIIKAPGDGMVNYTVLDVHTGKEKRQADAYIAAYAKGGETIGEFASPNAALDKAFELCPDK